MAIGVVNTTQATQFSLRMGPNDYRSDGTGGSTTSTTDVDLNTLTFTPSGTADYAIMAYASVALSQTNRSITPSLYHSTTATRYNDHTLYNRSTYPDYVPWRAMQVLTGLSGSQTFKIQMRVETLNTGYWSTTALYAMCLTDFPDYDYAESLTLSTTNSTSFVDKVSMSPTLVQDAPYIVFSNAWYRKGVNVGYNEARTIQDSSVIHSLSIQSPQNLTLDHTNHHSMRVIRPRATSATFAIQHRVQSLALSGILSANLLCIQLNDNPSVSLLGNASLLGNMRMK